MTYQPGPYSSPYPSPYAYPPGYGYDPMHALLAPARRAGIMMIVLGVLMLCLGVCGGIGLLIDPKLMLEQYQKFGMDLGPDPQETLRSLRMSSLISSIRMTVLGLPMLVLGIPVRSGRRAPVTAGIILSIIALLLVGLDIVGALVQAASNPIALAGICTSIIPLTLFTLQLIWLIQARRATATAGAMQMQYQQQYWQYAQQQQQAYAQAYPPQQPPTPPLPPRPIIDQPPTMQGESNEPPKGP